MEKVANDTVMKETAEEARILAKSGRFWMGLFGASFVIGLTGPFGTYDATPTFWRTVYWMFVVSTTFWLGYLISFAVVTSAEGFGLNVPVSLGIGAATASVPVTAWLASFHMAVFGTSFWTEAVELFPYVTAISFAVVAVYEALTKGEVGPVPSPQLMPEPDWLDQLPSRLGRELILLHAQDHYVCAETKLGQTLIRTTLQEAAQDLGEYGVRLHRSWWVARSAIKAHRYRKGAPVVVLKNGRELPVGRTYRRLVREALR